MRESWIWLEGCPNRLHYDGNKMVSSRKIYYCACKLQKRREREKIISVLLIYLFFRI